MKLKIGWGTLLIGLVILLICAIMVTDPHVKSILFTVFWVIFGIWTTTTVISIGFIIWGGILAVRENKSLNEY